MTRVLIAGGGTVVAWRGRPDGLPEAVARVLAR